MVMPITGNYLDNIDGDLNWATSQVTKHCIVMVTITIYQCIDYRH